MSKSKRPDSTGPRQFGAARFTVYCEHCIRLEYSADEQFCDLPTLFASERQPQFENFSVSRSAGQIVVETGSIRLLYNPDGRSFHPGNLQAEISGGAGPTQWRPHERNRHNLGGTLSTLDEVRGTVPLPEGLLARDGWYLLDDSGSHVLRDGWAEQRAGDAVDWYLFGYGLDFKAALRALAAVAGPVPMPRRHALGSWYSRWWSYTAEDYRRIVAEYRRHGFGLDVLVLDMAWHRQDARAGIGWFDNLGWTGWSWNRDLIPDPEALLAELRADGIFVALNAHPHDGVRSHEDAYETFMRSLGADPAEGADLPFRAGDRSYMDAYFRCAHEPHEAAGADFWWLDWQQDRHLPYVAGVPGLRHLPWLNRLYFQRSRRGGRRGMLLSRWAGWGDHRHPIHFSGDVYANWDVLAFEVPFTAAAGNVGCFFWSHDIGGFWGGEDAELLARWTQFGALSAALRLHSAEGEALDRRPWLWGEQTAEAMRRAYALRAELFPYIYSSVRQSCEQTVPLVRPMYIEYPERDEAYCNPQQYLFGDNLLVAPITAPGRGPDRVAGRRVWLPPGDWFAWFSGERLAGDSVFEVEATIYEFPLFARGGVPVPMQPITERMATEPLRRLRVLCWPGREGERGRFTLYEDDGQTDQYLQGRYAETALEYLRESDSVAVTISPARGSFDGKPPSRSVAVELPGVRRPTGATINGRATEVAYNEKTSTACIQAGERPVEEKVEVVLRW